MQMQNRRVHAISSYVAIGDSFTEGLDDPAGDGGYRGWADRLAAHLAKGEHGFRYANLAVRGKLLQQVIEEQVPRAVALRPDLVSIAAGGNDLLRPSGDPDRLAMGFAGAVRQLRAADADVLVVTGFDPRESPMVRRIRGKVAIYNMHLRAIADRYGCGVLDLWSMETLRHSGAWASDRIHLSPEGHRRVALRACESLGFPVAEDWREPWPEHPTADPRAQRLDDLRWVREFLLPWIHRRLRGVSSGDGLDPKRPDLTPLP